MGRNHNPASPADLPRSGGRPPWQINKKTFSKRSISLIVSIKGSQDWKRELSPLIFRHVTPGHKGLIPGKFPRAFQCWEMNAQSGKDHNQKGFLLSANKNFAKKTLFFRYTTLREIYRNYRKFFLNMIF